jgi:hypothetical protein
MTFQDWLRKTQPLLAVKELPENLALVRDGMGIAWDAAICEAMNIVIQRNGVTIIGDEIAKLRTE